MEIMKFKPKKGNGDIKPFYQKRSFNFQIGCCISTFHRVFQDKIMLMQLGVIDLGAAYMHRTG